MSSGHRHEHKLSRKELDDLLDEALAHPKVKRRLARPAELVTRYDVPLLGSSSVGLERVYLDQHLRYHDWPYGVLPVQGRRLDVKPGLMRHEKLEPILEDELGWPYLPLAHPVAQHWEERDYIRKGFDPAKVERAFRPYIKADAHERIKRCPTDMDLRPELSPPVDRELIKRIKAAQQREKRTQASVGYVAKSETPGQRCGKCVMFLEPKYGGPDCTLVKSEITETGWCRRFKAGKLGHVE